MNIDEFLKQVEADDTQDQRLITPVAYGRLRGIAPQLVYYLIRNKKLGTEVCDCGRRCISLNDADSYFEARGKLPPGTAHRGGVRERLQEGDFDLDRNSQTSEGSQSRSAE